MNIFVKTISKHTIPEDIDGKNLASLARECFLNQQEISIDFEAIDAVTQEFCQAFFFPLITEFGADFLKQFLKFENIAPEVDATIQSAFKQLDGYFDRQEHLQKINGDQEIYSLNHIWLIKARELCRENPVYAEFVLGITDSGLREEISRLSIEDIQYFAQVSWLCFAPRFTSDNFQTLNSKQRSVIDVLLALSANR